MSTRIERHTKGPWRAEHVCGENEDVATEIVLDYQIDRQGSPFMIGAAFFDEDDAPVIGPKEAAANALIMAAAPDAYELLCAIGEFFRHNNPVDPSATVLNDDRTLKEAVADYLKKARGL